MEGPYERNELSYVALYDTEYLRGGRWVLKMFSLDKETKHLIKQALAKT